jgi:hypothetical protein
VVLLAAAATAAGVPVAAVAAVAAEAAEAAVAEEVAAAPGVTVADLGWLAGCWRGAIGDEPVEEMWSTPEQGTMVGAFRWLGRRTLYEIMLFEDTAEGPVLRLRHFDPGLAPWEDGKDALVWRLVAAGERTATFRFGPDGTGTPLVYRLEADGSLVIELTVQQAGKPVPLSFRLRPLAGAAGGSTPGPAGP